MPLSAVCVSTVGGRNRAWPSQGSLPSKDVQDFLTMNSEEICTYRSNSQNIYTPMKKPAYFEYDISDDKPAKKEKKWSFGNLFRRKKKTNDSSSEEEVKDKIKKKSEKKKKPITFDHVVITPSPTKASDINLTTTRDESNLAFSSQSNQSKSSTFESLSRHQSAVQIQQGKTKLKASLDSLNRKSRKDLTKVRAEARRTSLNRNSSSDEDSQRSNSSQKFRSDESLYKTRDSSCNRKSRAARTERYLKRHSRDGENPSNYLRISKSDAESSFLRASDDSNRSPSASPQLYKSSFSSLSSQTPSVMGLSTIPPTHTHHGRFRVSNSTSNPSYKPPLSMNEYNNTAKTNQPHRGNVIFTNQRSISFDADIHRPHQQSDVIYAKLELGKPTMKNVVLTDNSKLRGYYNVYQPPAPPPRDPKRLHGSLVLDTLNHNTYDDSSTNNRFNTSYDGSLTQVRRINSVNRPAYKSSSENHIPVEKPVVLSQRPSSTTPVTTINRNVNSGSKNLSDNYQYLTDKQPRSRKPIVIQNESKKPTDTKESLTERKSKGITRERETFLELLQAKKSNRYSRDNSPQMFNCETKVKTEIFLPSVLPCDNGENKNLQRLLNGKEDIVLQENLDVLNRNSVEEDFSQAKSANLEEALIELEAIYNSLKLGDEDLLEMAEKREKEVATQKMLESSNAYQVYNGARGAFSDSGFSYEPFDSLDSRRRRRYSRKSLRSDDMAFRKMHKPERATTITDPQAVSSKISYLLTSPIYKDQQFEEYNDPNEPDVTLDDVVYRNIKQSNKMKVPEHPPPFGIPLGPITLAANSDYLHAVPDIESAKPSRMPDLVKDDLAFRNLRKDNTKEPALPPVSSEDLRNNNSINSPPSPMRTKAADLSELKRNRAVRSKSANIGSLISQEVIDRASRRNAGDKNTEYKTLTDIADAMQVARQVLRDKKLYELRTGSLSDTDSFHPKYSRFQRMDEKDVEVKVGNSNKRVETEESVDRRIIDEMLSSLSENVKPSKSHRRVKESTPDPISSFEDGKLAPLFKTNSFEDVLTALAIEAKEASDKFTQELEELDSRNSQEKEGKVHSPTPCRKLAVEMRAEENPEYAGDVILESVATIVFSTPEENPMESDHDYENIVSDVETNKEDNPIVEKSQEMMISGNNTMVGAEEAFRIREKNDEMEIQNKESQMVAGEKCVDVVIQNASYSNNVHSGMTLTSTYLSNNGSFHINPRASCSKEQLTKLESGNTLKSPKLVLETSKLSLRDDKNISVCPENSWDNIQASSSRNFLEVVNNPDSDKAICLFDNSPASLAIACSYGIACLYQLAALDLFTVLGVVLAIVSFIATLFF